MRTFFQNDLEGVATYWRVFRADGVTLGFASHDRDLRFGGLLHRAAPGMLPSAIRRTADLSLDSAEVEGVLSHDSIAAADLAAGQFDGAGIEIGLVDWETREHAPLYAGTLGRISEDRRGFSAELRSNKALLERDLVPRTSPTCRAEFCGPGCNLSAARFTRRAPVIAIDADVGSVTFAAIDPADFIDGRLRFESGSQAGLTFGIIQSDGNALLLDRPLSGAITPGTMAQLREGCDHTLATCRDRFGNAVNFHGEPFLPGNDLLARFANPK